MLAAGAGLLVLLIVGAILAYQDDVVRLEELVARLIEDHAVLPRRRRTIWLLEEATQLAVYLAHLAGWDWSC